jgi:manganese transport protein
MDGFIKDLSRKDHRPVPSGLDIIRYIGPGLLVTVGFIDPGNWASNLAAGSSYGYALLWIVSLSTIMLVLLQHNVAHLGIATGLCLSEAANRHLRPLVSRPLLATAMIASASTSLAEIAGGAIALQMLFRLPLSMGAVIVAVLAVYLLLSNTYRKIEKWFIGFVSVIGISFVYELAIAQVSWREAVFGWVHPVLPEGSMIVVMSVLGAVVMPHNLFLHSEIIQSRHWNLEDDEIIRKQLKYEFADTLFSMVIGWAINSAMVIMAAATFFRHHVPVDRLEQARDMLIPLLGNASSLVFAFALLLSGIASTITSGMAGGSISAGFFGEPLDFKDSHSRLGLFFSFGAALAIFFFMGDIFKTLIISQMVLSMQLPFTVFLQLYLTSSKKVMGQYTNDRWTFSLLLAIGAVITYLNMKLLLSFFS